ncbi:single-stranded-DNA-specific exonuclease RecJ [Fusobacterium vincentii 4_1_13]|uniref:Single-stranded-DNA-specific exonuclease RecJ n=2 Tax=Fusobacterium vincentii TaxID=155615 RepID=A0ABV3Y863_FUSVC|nr:single-stranded-DNA-specific exonuclease RecJ [Fusobacterium vincentii]EEO40214.1 single-stranded-DNA-specific exonuclease RecJ [Fusobacterium vincentii 4_1_13]
MKKNTKWILENKTNYKKIFENKREKKLDFIIEDLIENRNLSLDTNFDFNPFDLKDMDIATQRIFEAIKSNQKIYIYGDYDVDGITSVSLLYLALSELGANVDYYIPLRDEGYGLNKEAIQTLKNENADLVISVDCGINSIEEINFANELNLDFIITDHHEITGDIPKALAVINPKRDENIYSFKYLAGVGTAFMLVYALYTQMNKLNDLEKYLDIVAIGTVADIVPLVSDNRKFVKRGLKLLNTTKWIGIKQLLRKIFPDNWDTKEYFAYDVGYIIAPIFNAAGRLEDAKQAVSLFVEEDGFKCLSIIDKLLENNIERKNIQKKILEMSVTEIEKKQLYNKNLILVANKSFHHGVIGIVASKILDKYYKPTIIMEIKENEGVATASCRSIDGVNIVECLNSVSDILVKYGGHSGAAGFTIKIENIEEFYQRVDKYIEENFNKDLFIKKLKIEKILAPYKVNYEFLKELEILEPYGAKNHTPIFAFRNCEYENLRFTRNSTEHLMLDIKKDGYYFKNCIFFGGGDYYDIISSSKSIDIAFKLKLETFKDRYMYKLQLEDVKNSNDNIDFQDDYLELNGRDISFPIETVVYPKRPDIEEPLNLIFNDYGVAITKDRTIIENINLAKNLTILKNKFNYEFSVKIKKKYLKSENINLHLEIDVIKDRGLKSFPLKDALIFKEIKKLLIGNFEYNSIQKKVLASIFKDKKPTLAIMDKGRGISTIINTIKSYYEYKNKIVSINDGYKKADFYIFNFNFKYSVDIEGVFETLDKIKSNNILILSNKDFFISDFKIVKDNYSIPKNIEYIDYSDISILKRNNNLYHPFLTNEEKLNILDLIKRNKVIFSTREIIVHF